MKLKMQTPPVAPDGSANRITEGRALVLVILVSALIFGVANLNGARAETVPVERGAYLVSIAGCGDCHTPGYFLGNPDPARHLGGSEVGFEIPGLGVFHGPNLTPDEETGLGTWSEAEIVAALTTGTRPDGRILSPAMPWRNLAALTPDDAAAIATYLKSIPAVSNAVPGPFGPSETPTALVMRVIPPGQ